MSLKLENPITIKRPKYTDQNGIVVSPEPLVLDTLNIVYSDHPTNKMYYMTIEHMPASIVLFRNEEYTPNITTEQANQRFLELAEDDVQHFLQQSFPLTLEDDPYGPGSILAGMFSAIGIKAGPKCSCKRHALEMNKNGIEWCENNMDTICGWLEEECKARRIPYVDSIVRMVVKRAINKSKKYRDEKQSDEL